MLHNTPSVAVLTHIHYSEAAEGNILLRLIETVILRRQQRKILLTHIPLQVRPSGSRRYPLSHRHW